MGGKKRSSDSVIDEFEMDEIETHNSKMLSNKTTEKEDEPSAELTVSVKPMERRKKRKALDKERHTKTTTGSGSGSEKKVLKVTKSNNEQVVEVVADVQQPPQETSASNPQFHIDVFKDLASVDASAREAAAEKLVTELRDVQKAYEKQLGNKGTDNTGLKLEAEKDDGLENCHTSLRYAIRRLIRGVSSSRECARQGFALGLTLVVGTIPSIKVESLMKLITDILEVTSSMKGQEARDCLLGRLFAYGALARSGQIAAKWISDKNTPCVKEFTSAAIALAAKKRYLREPAVSVILDLVEKLPVEALLSQVLEAPGMSEWFQPGTEAGNPDALFFALKMREKLSKDNEIFGKLLPYPFSPNQMFASGHLSSLIPCFKESTFCQPRVHSLWPVLVNMLIPDTTTLEEDAVLSLSSTKKHKKNRKYNSSEEDIAKNLRNFCEIVVEGSLLLSSHDRKHLAFDILLLLLPKLPASYVHILLSHKLVQCLMDILSAKNNLLYKAAQYFLKAIPNCVKSDDDRRVAVIVALQKHSCGRFDSITRTKTVKDLIGEFTTASGCLLFFQNLVNMFVDEGGAADEPSDQSQTTDDNSEIGSVEDKDSAGIGSHDFLKSWVIESLPRVLKDLKLDLEAKSRVQKEILKFLAVQGLFSASLGSEVTSFELQEKFKWPKAATSSALRHMCIEQLQLVLANTQKGEGSASGTKGLEPDDLGSYFMRFLGTLCNIPSVSLFRSLSNEDETAFKKLQEMESRLLREERILQARILQQRILQQRILQQRILQERILQEGNIQLLDQDIAGKDIADANKLHAMRYLLIQLLLQVLLRSGEFHEAASELIMCCKKSFPSPDLLDQDNNEFDDNKNPELMDVLVDTLLSLLPQSSPPLRSAVEQVFKHFCIDLTDAGLLQMLRVIKKDLKPSRHQATNTVDEGDDDDEDFLDIKEAEETDEAEGVESGDSDDEENDSEVVAQIQATGKEVTEDDSDESDGGMDDDAMFRMDAYLAQIFKEKKNQAAGGETAQSQLVLFKLRVLSLLEIYLHENPGEPNVLTVYSYLAQAFVNPHTGTADSSEQLGQRILGILQKKIFKAKEYPKGEEIQVSTLESLLEKNLKLASRPFKLKKLAADLSKKKQLAAVGRHKTVVSLAQHSIFWILKILHARSFPEPDLQGVLGVFQLVLVEYFESKKSRLKPGFIKEVFKRQPWIGHKLFHFLVEKCADAKSEFRRTKTLDLVEAILNSVGSKKEDGEAKDELSKLLTANMAAVADLIWKLVKNMPKKQSWKFQVRRFCGLTFKVILTLNLNKEFLEALNKEAFDACQSELGDIFAGLVNINNGTPLPPSKKPRKSR